MAPYFLLLIGALTGTCYLRSKNSSGYFVIFSFLFFHVAEERFVFHGHFEVFCLLLLVYVCVCVCILM